MFQIGIQRDGYLLAVLTGEATLSAFRAAGALIREFCSAEGQTQVLIDLLGLTPELSQDDHHALGVFLGDAFRGLQVAVVVPAVERVGTSEEVARSAGAHLRTFTSLQDGEAWLKGGKG